MGSPCAMHVDSTGGLIAQADIAGSSEIAPGLYVGGQAAAAKQVEHALCAAASLSNPPSLCHRVTQARRHHPQVLSGSSLASVRVFAGLLTWTADELADELDSGVWFRAACSRVVALKQCLQLPLPLWREVLFMMGSVHAEIAAAA